MGANRFHFADDDDHRRPEPSVWVTRAIIAGVIVGLAGAAHVLLGLQLF